MPKGIKGFRWIETGCKVWQLEDDQPRHFRGCVSLISAGRYAWWIMGSHQQGEALSKRNAQIEVERRVFQEETDRVQVQRLKARAAAGKKAKVRA